MRPALQPRSKPARAPIHSGWWPPLLAACAVALLLAYPVRSFVAQAGLPAWLRACWLVAAMAAWRWPSASLCAFLAGAPLLPIVPRLAGWPAVSLGEAWLFALLAPAGIQVALGRRDWRAGLPAAFAILLVLVTASLAVALYPFQVVADGLRPFLAEVHGFLASDFAAATSQAHRFGSIGAWLTVVDGLALLWLIGSEPAGDRRRFVLAMAIAAAGGATAVALIGIVQWWTRWNLLPFWLQQDPNLVRINATFSDVNALGAFLVLSVWLPLALAPLRDHRVWRWGWRSAAALALAAVVFTGSRSAWAGVLVGCAVYVTGAWRSDLFRPPAWLAAHARAAVAASLVALALAGVVLTTYATIADVRHGDQRSYATRLLYTLNLRTSLDYRLRNRTAMWEAAVRMVAAHPTFGIGIGRYYKEAWAYTTRREAMVRPRENAHNYYLQIGAELGLSGLAAFLALMCWGLAAARRSALGADAATRRLGVACGAGITAFAVTLVSGHALLLREGQVAFWPIVAMAGLAGSAAGGLAEGRRRPGRWRSTVLVVLGVTAVAASVPFRAASAAGRLDLTRVTSGLLGEETGADGQPFSWTGDRAVLHAPADARAVAFELRSLAPSPQTVTLLVDNRVADTLVLGDHEWHPFRYVMPRGRRDGRFVHFEILVSPTWRPPDDERELGVIIRRFRWED